MDTFPHTFVVSDLDTLRALADPIRMQILEVMGSQICTVRDVAGKLGLSAGKLYYHFNTLEKIGLVRVVETRQVANLIEKQYQAAADSIDIDPHLLRFTIGEDNQDLASTIRSMCETTRDDMLRSLEARSMALQQGSPEQPRAMMIFRTSVRIRQSRAEEFQARLNALHAEFEAAESDDPADVPYAWTNAFYPTFYYSDEPSTPETE